MNTPFQLPQRQLDQLKLWLANVREARTFWETVPAESVAHNLAEWGFPGCGSIACFGGHLAQAGMFGIFWEYTYAPRLEVANPGGYGTSVMTQHDVSRQVFGANLFNMSYSSESFSEHATVMSRLDMRETDLLQLISQIEGGA